MINIKNIVDSAIEANIYAYKEAYKSYREYKHVSKQSKTKKDIQEFREISWRYLAELDSIEATLTRIFPDHEQYINDKLANAIWSE